MRQACEAFRLRLPDRMERIPLTYHLSTDRDFQKLWVGQGISLFGSMAPRLVLPFFIIDTLSGECPIFRGN